MLLCCQLLGRHAARAELSDGLSVFGLLSKSMCVYIAPLHVLGRQRPHKRVGPVQVSGPISGSAGGLARDALPYNTTCNLSGGGLAITSGAQVACVLTPTLFTGIGLARARRPAVVRRDLAL